MGRLARLCLFCLQAFLLAAAPAAAAPVSDAPLVRVITTRFVLSSKFEQLSALASDAGLRLDWRYAEALPEGEDPLAGAALVVIDTPRPGDLAQVTARLGPHLEKTALPWLRIGGGAPGFGNLPPADARRLIASYGAGGRANLRLFLDGVRRCLSGASLADLPPPAVMPETGLYHPDAPALFQKVEDYLAWQQSRRSATEGRVGFAISQSVLSNMQTRVIDTLIRAAEARGLVPLAFWYDESDPTALTRLLAPGRADVLVNLTHMQNGPARMAEFEALGLPVMQTSTYREGGIAAWRAAQSGIALRSVATTLSVPETWGMSDPLVISAVENGEAAPLPEQIEALLARAGRLVHLRRTPPAEKSLGLFFWNHPEGEKNISASHLNVPASLAALSQALAGAGYSVPPTDEGVLIKAAQAMLGAYYRPETLDDLAAQNLAGHLPVRLYQEWLARLPDDVREAMISKWGDPKQHWAIRRIRGEDQFVIPRLQLGKLTLLPQPPRAGRPGEAYHDTRVPPDHIYMAAYLYVREMARVDALIHLGTHGTQEWTPGKDRGLAATDFPFLAVGDLPVFYPYIQDNVAEALQARRRGRAVIISHQTPAFAPSGLYDELRDLHALVHEYTLAEEGAVRDDVAKRVRKAAVKSGIAVDMGWSEARIDRDFAAFMADLHDHLHDLAGAAIPLGLHRFGHPADPGNRLSTVMQQLGAPYLAALGVDEREVFADDFTLLQQSLPYRTLVRYLRDGEPIEAIQNPQLRALIRRAAELDRHLAEPGEMESLLAGLAGGFMRPGGGGDPIRNPDVASGRNLYGFEAGKLPTRSAYEAAEAGLEALITAYRQKHEGRFPRKLAFSLWSSEAIRHTGLVESQVLRALGLKPRWDDGGRLIALDIIPAEELGRPRIDVVLQVTSVYRDQFDGFMRLLAEAIDQLAARSEAGNTVADNTRAIAAQLTAQGMDFSRARDLAALRLFSNAPGDYGSGVPDTTLDSTRWDDDAVLAEQFLDRLQYAYGARDWGLKLDEENLLAAQLKGVEAAVLSRSSRLNGVLSTDHPFEYLGGLSLAIRHLSGKNPDLFIADARSGQPKVTEAAAFLAQEMRTRPLNPQWIQGMQGQGYAGATEILGTVNNLFGWQVMDPTMVRADQWQAIHDTYIRDSRNLGLNAWFEQHHPTSQAQIIDRMIEAVRKNYWQADENTLHELVARRQTLERNHGVAAAAEKTRAYMDALAAGFGLASAPPAPAAEAAAQQNPSSAAEAETAPSPDAAQPVAVRGAVLEKVSAPPPPAERPWRQWLGAGLLLLALLGGAWRQRRAPSLSFSPELV